MWCIALLLTSSLDSGSLKNKWRPCVRVSCPGLARLHPFPPRQAARGFGNERSSSWLIRIPSAVVSPRSFRQSNTSQQIGQTWVCAESRNELGNMFEKDQTALALFIRLLQPFKGTILLTQPPTD